MFEKIRNKANKLFISARAKVMTAKAAAAAAVGGDTGETYVDTGVKILIAVVIGALLLTLLYGLFSNRIFPTLTEKINGLFDYEG